MKIMNLLSVKFLIVILIVFVITLQAIYLRMLGMIDRHVERGFVHPVSTTFDTDSDRFRSEFHSIENKLRKTQVLDASGVYRIFPQLITIPKITERYNVTLVTHSSVHSLPHLIPQSRSWDGLISVSVFTVYDQLLPTLTLLVYLNTCVDTIRGRTEFHLVLPLTSRRINYSLSYMSSFKLNCGNSNFTSLFKQNVQNYDLNNSYPNNLLRNLAITNARTDYIMMLDIDILPNRQLYKQLQTFISLPQTNAEKIIYVLPVFEIKFVIQMPESKSELIDLWSKGFVRQFYKELCDKCQAPLDYDRWASARGKMNGDVADLNVLYTLRWKDPWEPFYVVKKPFPLYDERFKQYGFNRISQACELHIAGYSMAVLDSAFVVHQGFKYPGQFHPTKNEEQARHLQLFRQFKNGLINKYPESTNVC